MTDFREEAIRRVAEELGVTERFVHIECENAQHDTEKVDAGAQAIRAAVDREGRILRALDFVERGWQTYGGHCETKLAAILRGEK